nr:PQQ-like beta-propeller repeat protein [Bacteroidota bacterium]
MIPLLTFLLYAVTFCTQASGSMSLLPSWPDAGPPLIFEISGLGNGYSSPTIASDRIYVTGETDHIGYLYTYDLTGKLIWNATYGEEWTISYPGSRSAPTLAGDLLYICSGMGEIICFEAMSGNKRWSINLLKDLGGVNVTFGYSIPLLVDGEILYCSPGGEENNIVALNRFTGKLIWSSPAKEETAGYGSPLLIELPARKILVTSSEFFILGLDAGTGELLWSYELAFKGELPCNSPVFDGETLYWVAGPGNGAVAAQLSAKGDSIKVIWKNIEFDTFFGGFVQIGDYLYGSSDRLRKYVSVDTRTGKIINNLSFGIGSTIMAGNMLIGYNQQGQVGLIRPDKKKLELVNKFKISKGTNEHFSHPVISNGRLYIRHGDALMAYDIHSNE